MMLLNTNMQHQFLPSEEPRKNVTMGISAAVGVNVLAAPLTANISTLMATHHLLHVTQARSPEASLLTCCCCRDVPGAGYSARASRRPTYKVGVGEGLFSKRIGSFPNTPRYDEIPNMNRSNRYLESYVFGTVSGSTRTEVVASYHQYLDCCDIAPPTSQ